MTGPIPPKQTVNETVASERPQPHMPPPSAYQPYAAPSPGGAPPYMPPGYPDPHPGALVSIHSAALQANAESFPVLKAFQDYLEEERQRSRKRMLNLSISFMVVIVLVIGGFLAAGVLIFDHMARSTADMQGALVEAALHPQRLPAAPVVSEDTIERINQETRKIETALSGQLRSVSENSAALHEQLSAQTSNLGELQSSLQAMREENERLRADFASLQEDVPKITSGLDQAMGAIRDINRSQTVRYTTAPEDPMPAAPAAAPRVTRPSSPAWTSLAAAPPQLHQPDGYRPGTVPLTMASSDDTIQWQILIPE